MKSGGGAAGWLRGVKVEGFSVGAQGFWVKASAEDDVNGLS